MDAETRQLVRTRANHRCEYCGIHQRIYPDFAFHIEHIVARQHGGEDELDNLALSCHLCNSKKGPNLSGLDPDTGALTRGGRFCGFEMSRRHLIRAADCPRRALSGVPTAC